VVWVVKLLPGGSLSGGVSGKLLRVRTTRPHERADHQRLERLGAQQLRGAGEQLGRERLRGLANLRNLDRKLTLGGLHPPSRRGQLPLHATVVRFPH
jgi:hypothetical protein